MKKDIIVSIVIGALTMHSRWFENATLLEEIVGAVALAYLIMTCAFGYDFDFEGKEREQ